MFKLLKLFVPTSVLITVPGIASASANLAPNDYVGISFWLISMALVASTAFFFLETQRVSAKWKTSLTVSGLGYFSGSSSLFLYERCVDRYR